MRNTKTQSKRLAKTSHKTGKLPLIEHLYELRRRLVYIALCIGAGSMAAYAVQQQIVAVLLRPAHGQSFIYTSPLGGVNFLFGVCFDIGIAISVPIIVYNVLRFLEPLMHRSTSRFIVLGSIISGIVGLIGVAFGYFIGLPAALNFLLHQFTTAQIKPLVTIQAYLSFVSVYLLGSALMFQLPLFLIFINRIKPLKPGTLLKYERHVIVAAFIIGFVMNPTVNMIDQMLVVIPIILMYQVGILVVWLINRGTVAKVERLAQDAVLQAERAMHAQELQPALSIAAEATPLPATAIQAVQGGRGMYVDGIRPPRRTNYQTPLRRTPGINRAPVQ